MHCQEEKKLKRAVWTEEEEDSQSGACCWSASLASGNNFLGQQQFDHPNLKHLAKLEGARWNEKMLALKQAGDSGLYLR